MDPDAALSTIRSLCLQIDQTDDALDIVTLAGELIDHVRGLDHWIENGGFLPEPWQRGR